MNSYIYRWTLHLERGLRVEVEVEAESVLAARRTVDLLRKDPAGHWRVESVSRSMRREIHPVIGIGPLVLSPPRSVRPSLHALRRS